MDTTLIAQNDFIENLFINQDENDEFKDLYNFLKNDFSNYHLICDFKDLKEYNDALKDNPLWELLIDKFDTIEFRENIEKELNDESFYENLGQYNLFLTTQSNMECDKLTEERGFVFLCLENVTHNWEKFKSVRKGLHFKVTNSRIIPEELRLDCWSKLENFFSPLTSVIIFDKYILKDSTNQKLTDNLYPLLLKLLKNSSTKKPITVTIITDLNSDNIEQKHDSIFKFLTSKGINNFNLNIIKHFKAFYPRDFDGLHSRYILTNYYHIKSDDSFNFFKSNKKVNNDADVRVSFSLANNNRCFFEKELDDINRYLNKLTNDSSNPKPEYRILYFPNKLNNLLN